LKALDRLGRRRRDRRAQPQPDPPFVVEGFECVVDGPFALLRLVGTGSAPPASLVADGDSPQSFGPLPQSDAGSRDGIWRTAFAIPAELAEPGTRLWLHDGGVYLAELLVPSPPQSPATTDEPAPRARQDREAIHAPAATPLAIEHPVASADDEPGTDPRARKLVEAWSEAATLREKLSDREEELADALSELLAARKDVQPLRDRAEHLAEDLEAVREELELAHKQGRDARLRATEKAAELDAVRAELAAAEPRVTEAERAREQAEQELAGVREQVERLEQALVIARSEVDHAIRETEAKLEESTKKARRSGFGRRGDDRAVQKVRAELEGQIAEREQRIEQLEQEAESFAARRDDAVAESLRGRIGELEEDVSQHARCTDDLRSLLASERELVATARREVHELKKQLATAGASRGAAETPAPAPEAGAGNGDAGRAPAAVAASAGPPPWSALDDELLARIEKAKALTG
jgi:hypothetical protein